MSESKWSSEMLEVEGGIIDCQREEAVQVRPE